MNARVLKEVLQTMESWPEEAQKELAAIAREMDDELRGGIYHASREELAGIDRGLKAAREAALRETRMFRRYSPNAGGP